ncbi:pyroglutamyl-peptidase I [Sedimentibacter sp. zth1]|uniref:pyroglutamyl-peptidase I n=1 Tax=Sedimentibacter sp. zth1 TaxID=2816908 RepID=UPI001A90F398|nr:pyroglutamyl-peptidase I [Sedimentibacter sp. zth1]QSX05238.1 pyroglutamyl-peptidase I [Sedimentibacter sp. zth1]
MKILVTGFDPFGGEKVNPAYEAVKLLPKEIKGAQIITIEIPTVFGRGPEAVEKAIIEHNPNAVVCVGQAGGRSCISIERVGINLQEASIPDNDGNQPVDKKSKEDGENAYFATIPVKSMVNNVRKHGIPSHLSYTAGSYVCNDVMYSLLYTLDKKFPGVKGGFIHVPFATEQVTSKANNVASMPVETIAKGLEYSIEAIVDNELDINEAMGTTM